MHLTLPVHQPPLSHISLFLPPSLISFFFPVLFLSPAQVQLAAVTPPPAMPSVPTGLEDSLSGLSISSAPPTIPSEFQTGTSSLLLFRNIIWL